MTSSEGLADSLALLQRQHYVNGFSDSTVTLTPTETSLEGADKKWVETVSSKGRSMTLELVPQSQYFPPRFDAMGWKSFSTSQEALKAVTWRKCKRNLVTESHKVEFTSQVIILQTPTELPIQRGDQFFLSHWCASHLVKGVTAASSKSTWSLDHSKVGCVHCIASRDSCFHIRSGCSDE